MTRRNDDRPRAGARPLAAAAILLLTACTVGPDFKPPESSAPPRWSGVTATETPAPNAATAGPLATIEWWRTLEDPELDSLVQRAFAANLDLKAAEARVREARAARAVAAGGAWPEVDVSASYRRTSSPVATSEDGTIHSSRNLFQAGFDASWELDLFGGTRREVEAADADLQSTVEDRRDVLVTVAAEVTLDYVELLEARHRLAIARANLAAQEGTADLTRRRQQGGFVSALDVANAEAQVATTRSVLPALESQAQQSIEALGVLLGLAPSALIDELDDSHLPAGSTLKLPATVPAGLPAELLERRPDVRRAEAQLHAATARIGVATADLYPKLALLGSIGVAGPHPSSLVDWSERAWSLGPTVSWPLFDAGRLKANVEVQDARAEQARLAWSKSVLIGFQEVEAALTAYAKEQERHQALAAAVASNQRAVDLATRLYTGGQRGFLDVLDAQRSLFATQDALAQSDLAVVADLVALDKALGGGWEIELPRG